ncbi:MAG: hypothetical protein LUG59_13300, partial [Enterocloster clostridioformis]|nr:hypothetical protein [Enterocloster clostridioformis]
LKCQFVQKATPTPPPIIITFFSVYVVKSGNPLVPDIHFIMQYSKKPFTRTYRKKSCQPYKQRRPENKAAFCYVVTSGQCGQREWYIYIPCI